jgi:LPS-assembly protein
MYTARFRFDEDSFAVERAEFEGRATFDRWSVALLYGNYAAQPAIGFLERRDGVLGSASVKVTPNWTVQGSARYDIGNAEFDSYQLGVGYIDDCVAVSVSYITDFGYGFSVINTAATPTPITASVDHAVMLQISLRTLGGTAFSEHVGGF